MILARKFFPTFYRYVFIHLWKKFLKNAINLQENVLRKFPAVCFQIVNE